jgi:hypothetical protein
MNASLNALSIQFHALPTSKGITQDYATGLTIVDLSEYLDGINIIEHCIGVFVDGLPQWTCPFRHRENVIAVRPPLRQEGERVELRCIAVPLAPKGGKPVQATYPSPNLGYGLQAPILPKKGPPQ